MPRSSARRTAVAVILLAALPSRTATAQRITPPVDQFGFAIGDDYHLANYSQLSAYWRKLAEESDRIELASIGKTAEGRDQWMAIVTSPANHARLDHYRGIAARLARARELTDAEARRLAAGGKTVVWIDGGLHATEVLGAHQLIEHLYRMASASDPETLRILDNVIQLVVHANPDGMELVSNWYMREAEPTARSTSNLPRLYQKYVGHDNNRDFYMNAMPETKNLSRVMYREWYPQIIYNHHQTGPAGAVMFAPPFRDPHNYLLEPILLGTLNMIGDAIHTRFATERKPGVVQRDAASYQTWWNGGLRTTPYFHNMVGLLTETIGHPTPTEIPVVPARLVANGSHPYPIRPQVWKFKQSVEYSLTANRAVLDYAVRYREHLLFNVYLMGKVAIQKGLKDTWTVYPSRVARMEAAAPDDSTAASAPPWRPRTLRPELFDQWLRRPEDRDPRGYVLPADQTDFLTATKFANALIESGVEVHAATTAFSAGGKNYPAGSYVIKSAQAFRAHVLDMLEPQDYPNDLLYPGGPPKAPYDAAGYTLALQMGVQFDRLLDGFTCPCELIEHPLSKPPVAAALPTSRVFALSRRVNDSYLAVNRLLAAGQQVEVVAGAPEILVRRNPETTRILSKLVADRGLPVASAGTRPAGAARLSAARVGLWDRYGGSMPSGWLRWMFEQFEFPFEVVYAPTLDAGNLNARFDVLVFVGGSIPSWPAGSGDQRRSPDPAEDVPGEYRGRIGRVTVDRTIPALRAFLEAGGRVVTIGSSTSLARHLNLPIDDYLVEHTAAGGARPLPRDKFFVPGSLMEVALDPATTSGTGMDDRAIVMFDESPVFRLPPNAGALGIRPVAWFDSATTLKSGWAWGQSHLNGGVAMAEARVGRGTLFLFGPEITFRSQSHGTFRLLFNALWGR